MPRYFFDVKNGHRLIDPSGLECRDTAEAMAQATVIARQIADDAPPASQRHVAIRDGDGNELGKVPVIVDEDRRSQAAKKRC
jgi:hypothetical protein